MHRLLAPLLVLAACGGSSGPSMVQDFLLEDVNPNSPTSTLDVSPRDYIGNVSAWYFGAATWGYCSSQFGYLDQMQDELFAESSGTTIIRLLGCNQFGAEAGNGPAFFGSRDLPWTQDTFTDQVWALWQVNYRDVWVLDADNIPVAVYNLNPVPQGGHDLSVPANYAELKQILKDAAGE